MKSFKISIICFLLFLVSSPAAEAQFGWGWSKYYSFDKLDTVVSIPKYKSSKLFIDDDNFYFRSGFLGVEVEVEDNWDSWDYWENENDDESWRTRRRRRSRDVEYYQQHDHGTLRDFNFEIGINNWLENGKVPSSDDLYQMRPINSTFVGVVWNHTSYIKGPLYLDWGGGINWYNFKFENARTRLDPNGGQLVFYEDFSVPSARKSKLKVTYLNFNLIPVFDFGRGKRLVRQIEQDDVRVAIGAKRGFRFGIGPYGAIKLGQKAKYNYKNENGNQKDNDRGGFYVNQFKWGLRAQIGINRFDMFFSYDMTPLFEDGKGPRVNPFAVAIVF
jgi:hypothetical protein